MLALGETRTGKKGDPFDLVNQGHSYPRAIRIEEVIPMRRIRFSIAGLMFAVAISAGGWSRRSGLLRWRGRARSSCWSIAFSAWGLSAPCAARAASGPGGLGSPFSDAVT